MSWIIENWYIVLSLVALIGVGGYVAVRFFGLPTQKQLAKVKEWLLYAVVEAEKQLGSQTGTLKLRLVYDMFVARFGWIAKMISFELFSTLVDEALVEMRHLLETNNAVKALVTSEEPK